MSTTTTTGATQPILISTSSPGLIGPSSSISSVASSSTIPVSSSSLPSPTRTISTLSIVTSTIPFASTITFSSIRSSVRTWITTSVLSLSFSYTLSHTRSTSSISSSTSNFVSTSTWLGHSTTKSQHSTSSIPSTSRHSSSVTSTLLSPAPTSTSANIPRPPPPVPSPTWSNKTTSANITSTSSSLRSLTPPPGWDSTRPPPSCTDSISTSDCIDEGRMTTQVITYGDELFTIAFSKPDITTTQSYWTGTYPTKFRTEPSATTTRSIRQSALSDLPSFHLFTSGVRHPSTFVTTVVSGSVTRTTTEVAAAEATLCGETGNFTLTFDDSTIGAGEKQMLSVQGMNNPYHHLFYANGFTYMPDKWEPYPAKSQPHVAMFLPLTGKLLPNNAFAGSLLPGEVGAGPRASVNAYWFHAHSGWFGCILGGLTPCTLHVTGYRYDSVLKQEVVVAEQKATIPACWGYLGCQLWQVNFTDSFRALSGIQFSAYTYGLGIQQVYVLDDLRMEWYNGSCGAGILRMGHR
ncbi:hypothetical protein B0J11DRAFT_535718 [Dendryphion nanum]|uniref:DUF7371 domain-containing protein n=1 Tax=Dendryphion nanum TaxID=256645 RepID=A0A9P9IGM7_9PLEO|nr:hypothetical protein B0J11DRAFT_535718 [Dendryphion nanum]